MPLRRNYGLFELAPIWLKRARLWISFMYRAAQWKVAPDIHLPCQYNQTQIL